MLGTLKMCVCVGGEGVKSTSVMYHKEGGHTSNCYDALGGGRWVKNLKISVNHFLNGLLVN